GEGSSQSTFTNAGTVKKSSGTAVSYVQGNLAFTSTGTVQVQSGTLEFDTSGNSFSGTINGAGNLIVHGASTFANLTIGGTATVTNKAVIDESGPVTLGDNTGAAATLANQSTYNFDNDSGIGSGTGAGSALVNTGTLAKTGGTGVSHVAVQTTNT